MDNRQRMLIRIGNKTLDFATPLDDTPASVDYEPYVVKSGMSMAANLREAFREKGIDTDSRQRVQVLCNVPTLIVPIEEYDESLQEELYDHAYPGRQHEVVMHQVVPELNCVIVYAVNKDVRMVVTDHFADARFMPVIVPVMQRLHQKSYTGQARKLFAYFHDGELTILSYGKNRLKFCNTFTATETADSTYFILYVWQQLAMDFKHDELYVAGLPDNGTDLRAEVKKYVANVYPVSASAELNRAAITQLPGITYDVIAYLTHQ